MRDKSDRPDLYDKDGRLRLRHIAGGEAYLNAEIAGSFKRHMAIMKVDTNGLAMLVCLKVDGDGRNFGKVRGVVNAIYGQRLREVKAEDVKGVFSAIGLRGEDCLCLPILERWRDRLVEEMKGQGYEDFSDDALKEYMAGRILEDLCQG